MKTHLLEAVGSSAFDIEVESTDGVVRLIGKVAERRQADLAVEAAWKADGVREVHDLISVSSK